MSNLSKIETLLNGVWCAKHRDGWCAIKPNRKPPDDIDQVATRCGYFICLPWGLEKREPTCSECRQ